MKKLVLIVIAVIGFAFAANAQDNAIGVRIGGGQGYNAEISYQRSLGAPHRLEIDLGYYNPGGNVNAFSLTALYQVHFDIKPVPNLGWYAGVGPKLNYVSVLENSISLGVAGQAGLDYHFEAIPLQLSLDFRPCFYVLPSTDFTWGDFALGIRYTF